MMIGVLLNIDLYPLVILDGCLWDSNFTISRQTVKLASELWLLYSLSFRRNKDLLICLTIGISHALFSVVNIIRDGATPNTTEVWGWRGSCCERFSYLKFTLVKLNSPVCLSQRGVNEWGMNNAGQRPIVWWRPSAAQGAAQETLWNIDSPLKSCCVDVGWLVEFWKGFLSGQTDTLQVSKSSQKPHKHKLRHWKYDMKQETEVHSASFSLCWVKLRKNWKQGTRK